MKTIIPLTYCPSDDELMRYKLRQTSGEDFERITEHLATCDSCIQMIVDILPETEAEWKNWKSEEIAQRNDYDESLVGKDLIDDEFLTEFEKIRTDVLKVKKKFRLIDDIPANGRFKAGQVWRPKAVKIAVPMRSHIEYVNTEDLGSFNRFVVLITGSTGKVGDFETIDALVLSDEIEYAGDDVIIPPEANPLEVPLLTESWNRVELLIENLEGCYGEIDVKWATAQRDNLFPGARESGLFSLLWSSGEEGCIDPSYLVSAGLMQDPKYRFRAREFAETHHLRFPIEMLRDEFEVEASPSVLDRVTKSLNNLLEKLGTLAEALSIRAISEISTREPARAADNSMILVASLEEYRGGSVSLEIERGRIATLQGQFDFPSMLRASLYYVPTGDWIDLRDAAGNIQPAPWVKSGHTSQIFDVNLPADRNLKENLRLVIVETSS